MIYLTPFLFPQWCVENYFFLLRTIVIKRNNLYNYPVKEANRNESILGLDLFTFYLIAINRSSKKNIHFIFLIVFNPPCVYNITITVTRYCMTVLIICEWQLINRMF